MFVPLGEILKENNHKLVTTELCILQLFLLKKKNLNFNSVKILNSITIYIIDFSINSWSILNNNRIQ